MTIRIFHFHLITIHAGFNKYVLSFITLYKLIPLQRLDELNAADPDLKGQLYNATAILKFAFMDALTLHSPFTIFVPTDKAFKTSLRTYEVSTG